MNKQVGSYKGWDDILFISLAMDKKERLAEFLKDTKLQYATIPEMKDYMHDKLAIGSYPTHILVDKAGKIVKVVDRIDELKPFLKRQASATVL